MANNASADLTPIQKVVNNKAEEALSKDLRDFVDLFKESALGKRLELLSFKTGDPKLQYTSNSGRTETTSLKYILQKESNYLKDLKEWLRPFYEREQAEILVQKFNNLTDII
jgi:hypothetical protein